MNASDYRARLALPTASVSRPVSVVIDSDVANEIDDQFALTWAMLSPSLKVHAIYACPFSFAHRRAEMIAAHPACNPHSRAFNSATEGMQRSYDEAHKVLDLLGPLAHCDRPLVLHGSQDYLANPQIARPSPAVEHLLACAKQHSAQNPLYVLALGCLTNIASALLIAPEIKHSMVLVWTAGFPSQSTQINQAFNLEQDLAATQVVFNSGLPLVYLPGYHVGVQLRISLPEMQSWVQGRGAIGNYLHQLYTNNPLWDMLGQSPNSALTPGYSWVIWDLICVAWLINPAWVPTSFLPIPELDTNLRWRTRPGKPPMREAWTMDRNAVYQDFFSKLALLPTP